MFKPKGKSDRNDNFAQIIKDGFATVTKAFKKDLKKAYDCKGEKKRKHDSEDSESSWSFGPSSTGESIVINKSKRLEFNIPSSPIKTAPLDNTSSFEQMTDNL